MLAVLPFRISLAIPNRNTLPTVSRGDDLSVGPASSGRIGNHRANLCDGIQAQRPTLGQIGRDLSVQYVLENSLRGSGDHLRVTVQLIRVMDQSHLWAQDYDYRPRDILSLEMM